MSAPIRARAKIRPAAPCAGSFPASARSVQIPRQSSAAQGRSTSPPDALAETESKFNLPAKRQSQEAAARSPQTASTRVPRPPPVDRPTRDNNLGGPAEIHAPTERQAQKPRLLCANTH